MPPCGIVTLDLVKICVGGSLTGTTVTWNVWTLTPAISWFCSSFALTVMVMVSGVGNCILKASALGVIVKVRLVPPVFPPKVRPLLGIILWLSDVAVNVRPERGLSMSLTNTLIVCEESSLTVTVVVLVMRTTGLMKRFSVQDW